MNLLLVLGAGASRDLGRGGPMPLMPDWSDALCQVLDAAEEGLAYACYLEPELDGPTFEENLGLLLRWESFRQLERRFDRLGSSNPRERFSGARRAARIKADERMEVIKEALNSTLYEQFGQRRIDQAKASEAYGQVLQEIGDAGLIVATTNYDRAAESALRQVGRVTSTGFSAMPEMTPELTPSGLVDDFEKEVPVIHLHGAVGWYEFEGVVSDHYGDRPYNPTLGAPVVLYPDPDKDPTSNPLVQQLWDEFHQGMEIADLILVIGHSLHDPALTKALNDAVEGGTPVVISYLEKGEEERIDELVYDARIVEMEFGPKIKSRTSIGDLLKKHGP